MNGQIAVLIRKDGVAIAKAVYGGRTEDIDTDLARRWPGNGYTFEKFDDETDPDYANVEIVTPTQK